MPIGIIYGVKNLTTGRIEKVGSTIQSLHSRAKQYRSRDEWFRNGQYELVSIKTIEDTDSEFFLWHLYASENLEIANRHTWIEEGGRNVVSPLMQRTGTMDFWSEVGKAGGRAGNRTGKRASGRIQGRKNVESGQLRSISVKGATAAGRKAVDSGQIQALGRKNANSGQCARTLALGRHTYWHTRRNKPNPACKFCIEEKQ